VRGRHRDADADRGRDVHFFEAQWRDKSCGKAAGEIPDLVLAADAGLDHDEFVAAKTGHDVCDAGCRAQALGDRLEQEVAAVMPKGVVDLFETVDVEEMHGEAGAPHRQSRDLSVQSLDQLGAVGEARQRVVMREKADAPVGLLFLPGAAIPCYGRNPEGQYHQPA
jgi:hypothetical protein